MQRSSAMAKNKQRQYPVERRAFCCFAVFIPFRAVDLAVMEFSASLPGREIEPPPEMAICQITAINDVPRLIRLICSCQLSLPRRGKIANGVARCSMFENWSAISSQLHAQIAILHFSLRLFLYYFFFFLAFNEILTQLSNITIRYLLKQLKWN